MSLNCQNGHSHNKKDFFLHLSLVYDFWKPPLLILLVQAVPIIDLSLQTVISKCNFLRQDVSVIGIEI